MSINILFMKLLLQILFCFITILGVQTTVFGQQTDKELDSLLSKGLSYVYNQPDSALIMSNITLEHALKNHDSVGIIRSYRLQGNAYYFKNEYYKSFDAYNEGLSLANKINDSLQMAYTLANLANVYHGTMEYDKAIELYEDAITFFIKIGEDKSVAKTYNNMGLIYQYKKEYEKALSYYQESLRLKDDKWGTASTLANIGSILHKLERPEEAINNLKKAIELFEKSGETQRVITSEVMLAKVFYELKEPDSALFYLQNFILHEKKITSKEFRYQGHNILYDVYKDRGEFKRSLFHLEQYKLFEDSIQIFQITERQELMDIRLDYEQLRVKTAEGEIAEEKSKRESFFWYSVAIISIILISTLFILFVFRNRHMRKKMELNELKSGMVQIVSHEFRTPLAGINSSTEIIESISIDKEIVPFIDRIYKSTDQMNDILSSFRGMEEGQASLTVKKFNLSETVEKIIKSTFNPDLISTEINLHQDEIGASETIFTMVLRNLLSNAIKYAGESPTIKVKIYKNTSEMLIIEVSDNGIGFKRGEANQVFKKGVRVSNHETEGQGMGLYIVKSYLNLIGGKIRLKSKYGQGTTFIVQFPLT